MNYYRYDVGDQVIVREYDDMAEEFGNPSAAIGFVSNMKRFCGQVMTVKRVDAYPVEERGRYFRLEDRYGDDEGCCWSSNMVRPADYSPVEEVSVEDLMAILQE